MASKLEVYEDRLRKAGSATGKVRDAIHGVMSTLNSSLAGRGAPWGGDKIGKQFYDGQADDGYKAGRKKLGTSAANMAMSFNNFSTSQYKAATELAKMDKTHEFS